MSTFQKEECSISRYTTNTETYNSK